MACLFWFVQKFLFDWLCIVFHPFPPPPLQQKDWFDFVNFQDRTSSLWWPPLRQGGEAEMWHKRGKSRIHDFCSWLCFTSAYCVVHAPSMFGSQTPSPMYQVQFVLEASRFSWKTRECRESMRRKRYFGSVYPEFSKSNPFPKINLTQAPR